jgi:Nuclease-related domain
MVARILLARFRPPHYHLMNHVTLRMEDGTTQVDHILVSRFGVFVIETKDYSGWIFAYPAATTWIHTLPGRKYSFQNPVRQNFRHICAVRTLLDFLPPDAVRSIVVFSGRAEFKTRVPDEVLGLDALAGYIGRHNTAVMSAHRMLLCVGRLETARLAITGQTDVEHVRSLARRLGHGAA